MKFPSLPPLSVYIHIPWCERKCPYCDFNSHPRKPVLPEAAYIDALLADLDQERSGVDGRPVHSVFIGGGTPSLFSAASMDRLLSGVRARLDCIPGVEITLEANPGSSEQSRFRGFRNAGVNRISLGIQSFDDRHLAALGRVHNGAESRRAIDAARAAGFDNINLDMMFALPGQTPGQARRDIATAVDHGTSHISYYQLTIEPNTAFFHHPPPLPDDDTAWDIQRRAQDLLRDAGFQQYEISAYAAAGAECRHNLNYWRFGDYLGIGAGAHSKITFSDRVMRFVKVKHPAEYLQTAASGKRIRGLRRLDSGTLGFEFMLNALRLRQPLAISLFEQRTGQPVATILPILDRARDDALLEFDHRQIRVLDLGYRFLNDLLQRFLPEAAPAYGQP